jgi:hypothetical protein
VDAAADELVGDLAEEPFDEVEPAGAGRGEVQMEPRVAQQPSLHGRRLVGGVVVQDQVHLQVVGDGALIRRRKLRNSWWRWRCTEPITLPVATSNAANKLVTPART